MSVEKVLTNESLVTGLASVENVGTVVELMSSEMFSPSKDLRS